MRDESKSELQPGARFGNYEIVRTLGSGAFGSVYEALRQPLGKRVALKVLHAQHAARPEVIERFMREAKIVAQIEHPHLVGAFEVSTEDQLPFLAMEFLEGESLAEKVDRDGPLAPEAAVDVMLAICSALVPVHAKGIVHRDIKPANIFLARTAVGALQPRLLDFGIAKMHDAGDALTKTRAIVGTPHYMSPEQVREAKSITGASDQWSLAVVLYQCLAGTTPFHHDTMYDVFNAITGGPIGSVRALNPAVPEGLEAVLARAFEREPGRRYASMRVFGAALLPFASTAARAQWAVYFARDASTAMETIDSATSVAPISRPPIVPSSSGASASLPAEARTHESADTPATPSRSRIGLAVALVVALIGGGGVLVRHALRSEAGAASTAAPTSDRASSEPVGESSGVRSAAHASASEVAAATATATATATVEHAASVVIAPSGTAVPPAVVSAIASAGRRHHGGGSTRPSAEATAQVPSIRPSARPRDPSECPNGICPVD